MPRLKLKDRIFYGWVVVIAFLVLSTAIWGIRFSYGVFFKSIEADFGLSRTTTSAVFSFFMVFNVAMPFIGGWALRKYGPRIVIFLMGLFTGLSLVLTSQAASLWQLFIAYSLLLSIGGGALFTVLMSNVSRWFDKKRGLALGIASSGAGLGMVVTAPFATFLVSHFGWRVAFLVIGIVIWIVVIPLSALLKRDPQEIGVLPDGVKSSAGIDEREHAAFQPGFLSPKQAIRTRSMWLIASVWFLFGATCFLILTHIVPHLTDIGFSAGEAAVALSLMGLANIAGRILLGILSDRVGGKVTVTICTLVEAISIMWLIYLRSLWPLYIFSFIYGFFWGGLTVAIARLVASTFGLRRMGEILGIIDAGFGIGAAIGPALGGRIYDLSGSYFLAFISAVAAMLIATLSIALVRRESAS